MWKKTLVLVGTLLCALSLTKFVGVPTCQSIELCSGLANKVASQ